MSKTLNDPAPWCYTPNNKVIEPKITYGYSFGNSKPININTNKNNPGPGNYMLSSMNATFTKLPSPVFGSEQRNLFNMRNNSANHGPGSYRFDDGSIKHNPMRTRYNQVNK